MKTALLCISDKGIAFKNLILKFPVVVEIIMKLLVGSIFYWNTIYVHCCIRIHLKYLKASLIQYLVN